MVHSLQEHNDITMALKAITFLQRNILKENKSCVFMSEDCESYTEIKEEFQDCKNTQQAIKPNWQMCMYAWVNLQGPEWHGNQLLADTGGEEERSPVAKELNYHFTEEWTQSSLEVEGNQSSTEERCWNMDIWEHSDW